MPAPVRAALLVVLGLVAVVGLGRLYAGSGEPVAAGPDGGALAACPATPNCVSTSGPPVAEVEPLACDLPPAEALDAAVAAATSLPRTELVERDEAAGYAHLTATSRVFGFVDDLELLATAGGVEVRSASRVGTDDLGVNAERVEALRAALTC
ncbi:MAG: DUF1499 domain-containing protein [Actinomycetes bacterium]